MVHRRIENIDYASYDAFSREDLIEELANSKDWNRRLQGKIRTLQALLEIERANCGLARARVKELEREDAGEPAHVIARHSAERAKKLEAIQMILDGKWGLDTSGSEPRIVRGCVLRAHERHEKA